MSGHSESQNKKDVGFWQWIWDSLCGIGKAIKNFFSPTPPQPLRNILEVEKDLKALRKSLDIQWLKTDQDLYNLTSKSKDPKIARTAWMYDKPKTLERRMSFSDITIKHPSLPSSKTQDTEFHKPITVTFLKR